MRLDLKLVEEGLASSRSKAQELIENSWVQVSGKIIKKSSYKVSENEKIEIIPNSLEKFVSRAGLKLEGALEKLELSVEGYRALDLGISTGGFTDCLLQRGARFVVGVDVGRGQVAEKLRGETKLLFFDEVNAKNPVDNVDLKKQLTEPFDLIVADLSFISITKVLPNWLSYVKVGGEILSLVKPQFELGAKALDKKGVVKDEGLFKDLETNITHFFAQTECQVMSYFPSPILGKDGNKEFFIYLKKG